MFDDLRLPQLKIKLNLYEKSANNQSQQSQTFGMIKLLDDSICRLLLTLKDNDLEDHTVGVFISD